MDLLLRRLNAYSGRRNRRLCSSCRISCASLQTRLLAQSLQHRPMMDFVRERFPLPANYRPSFRGATHNPRSMDPPSRPPTVQIGRDMQPRDIPGRKGSIPFPDKPWVLEQPRLRVESKPLRGCLCLPAMVLPESYQVGPAFARALFLGNNKDALPLAVLHRAFLPIPQCMWKDHASRQPRARR